MLGGRSWAWHDIVDLLGGTTLMASWGCSVAAWPEIATGLIAADMAAVYPLLIAADGSLRSETVFALLVTLSLLVAIWCRERRRRAVPPCSGR